MRAFALLALSASLLPSSLSIPLSAPPIRTRSINAIPPDLYKSANPFFAGLPIVLSDPIPASQSSPGPGRYAISYTPYTPDGLCKAPDAVASDIARIRMAGFSAVRLYATDCQAVRSVGRAAISNNLQLILGLHISENGVNDSHIHEQVEQIQAFISEDAAHLGIVDAVIVGNEAVFNHFATPWQMVSLLTDVRSTLRDSGYTGPVTTTEPYGVLVEHAATLCPALDMVAANLLPFFNADISPRAASTLVKVQTTALESLCDPSPSDSDEVQSPPTEGLVPEKKPVLALEIAWPSAGQANGLAVPGLAEQRTALAGMAEVIGTRAVFSSFEDDAWRDGGDFGVETHWGCVQVFE